MITYEELVLEDQRYVSCLMERLDLAAGERMLSRENRPSRTTDPSTAETEQKIRRRDKTYLVRKWEERVSRAREEELLEIQEVFDLVVYSTGRDLAGEPFLSFE